MKLLRGKILLTIQDLWDLIIVLVSTIYMYIRAVCKYFVPLHLDSLDGKVILVISHLSFGSKLKVSTDFQQITGSAGGIGLQICNQLAATGAILICWDVDKQSNDKFVSGLTARTGVKAFSYHVDVSDKCSVKAAIERVRTRLANFQ